jgi:hypothetical protein
MMAYVTPWALLVVLIGVLPALLFFWFPPRQKVHPNNDAAAVAVTETIKDSGTLSAPYSIQQPSWKCACTTGSFLPPGLLKSVAGQAEATLRMGTGQCYHQQ